MHYRADSTKKNHYWKHRNKIKTKLVIFKLLKFHVSLNTTDINSAQTNKLTQSLIKCL